MKKKTIALLSGGRSSEREVSLNGGDQVFNALDTSKYHVLRYDPKMDLHLLVKDASKIDVALIILHGPYGEDGRIQGFLDLLDIPYQGSGVLGSALAMNKIATKQVYHQSGLPAPSYVVINKEDDVDPESCFKKLGLPVVVKPACAGSSIGMSLVKEKNDFQKALETAFLHDDTLLIEAFISGLEITGSVIGNENLTALPIVEIIPNKNYDFFEYEAKYNSGETTEICPARISETLTKKAQSYAKTAHKALFCRGYSRTDMICFQDDIYVLETNTIPGMTQTSLLPLAANTAGISFAALLDQLIELAIEEHQCKSGFADT